MSQLDGQQIVGIKKVLSKDGKRTYTSYFVLRPWTDYELDNANDLAGNAVEEVTTSENFPLNIGDVVKFFYGKAISTANGLFDPVVDYKLIRSAVFPDKEKK